MSSVQALKAVGDANPELVASGNVVHVPHGAPAIKLTGTTLIGFIFADGGPGRLLRVDGSDDGGVTIGGNDTGNPGEIDLGGTLNQIPDAAAFMVLRKTVTESWELFIDGGLATV